MQPALAAGVWSLIIKLMFELASVPFLRWRAWGHGRGRDARVG